jgi:hypothetical protein
MSGRDGNKPKPPSPSAPAASITHVPKPTGPVIHVLKKGGEPTSKR